MDRVKIRILLSDVPSSDDIRPDVLSKTDVRSQDAQRSGPHGWPWSYGRTWTWPDGRSEILKQIPLEGGIFYDLSKNVFMK